MSDLTKHVDNVTVDVPPWLDISDWPAYRAWLEGEFETEEEYKKWRGDTGGNE